MTRPLRTRTVITSAVVAFALPLAMTAGTAAADRAGAPAADGPSGAAPGAPGAASTWVRGDKDGFGTSRTLRSKAWYTLNNGVLS
ncbi:MAG: Glucodextranase, domain, partial [Nocardioidaceae bacterium]|nr:Glucodextranase, domain [Nocardioidaceae bacterium]